MYLGASQRTFGTSGKSLASSCVTVDVASFAWSLIKHIFLNIGELAISGIFLTACPNLEMMLIEVQYITIVLF